MHCRPFFVLISILSAVSALAPDPSWFLNEDLSSNMDLSSSPEFLSAALPLDLDFGTDLTTPSADPYSTDISSKNDLSWDAGLDSNNLFGSDSSLLVADCPSAESFPTIGKSRIRRLDRPSVCNNDAVNNGASTKIDLPTELFSPGGLDQLDKAITGLDQPQNSPCFEITLGLLPVGVCSTAELLDTLVVGAISVRGIQFVSLTLRHVTFCTFSPRLFILFD